MEKCCLQRLDLAWFGSVWFDGTFARQVACIHDGTSDLIFVNMLPQVLDEDLFAASHESTVCKAKYLEHTTATSIWTSRGALYTLKVAKSMDIEYLEGCKYMDIVYLEGCKYMATPYR